MLKRTLLSIALTLACSSAFATAFYVVVPLKNNGAAVDNINVVLSPDTPPQAIVGTPYSYDLKPRLMVTGDAGYSGIGVTWTTVTSTLPAGLALGSNGVISGTPLTAGNGTITARASYRSRSGDQTYQIVSLYIQVTLASATLPDARVGSVYASFDFKNETSVSGDPGFDANSVNFSATDLPAGLSLSSSGVLTGTPTVKNPGGAQFTVVATYKTKAGQQAYTLIVNGKPLDVTQVSAGYGHTCAVITSGGAMCWGSNTAGELGNGTTVASAEPVAVSGLASNVASVATGYSYSCALTTAGAVLCWGSNSNGQLGNNSTTNSSMPVPVQGLASGVSSISAGVYHACARTTGGGAQCWGANGDGQLGNNSTTDSHTPVSVSGLAGVAQIAAGYYHTCAVTSTGGAKCWGYNNYGQLGNNSTASSSAPMDVSGLTSGVARIQPGYYHTCAITTAAGATCWGLNSYGQLGNGGTANSSIPVAVSGLASGVSQISAGYYHTCALTSGGVKCWGQNSFSQLGNGTANSAVPVIVPGVANATSLSAGRYHNCATTSPNGVSCWGYNAQGQLGNGTTTTSASPVAVDYP